MNKVSYYQANKERIKEKVRKWQADHVEERKAYMKAYYAKNRAKLIERNCKMCAEKYAANPDIFNARTNQWRKNNPEKARNIYRKRRVRVAQSEPQNYNSIIQWEKSVRSKANVRCYWCRRMTKTADCHMDHIVPVAKGGQHSIENLCMSCSNCNQRKSAKNISRWNQELSNPVLSI